MKTPILFTTFNRPKETFKVFNVIKSIKPTVLYISSDGPRENNNEDRVNVLKCRSITKLVDWDCRLETLFRDENLGCKNAMSSSIDWFFSNEENGIILEDDCLPDPTFFNYCEILLNHFKDNEKIAMISGLNLIQNKLQIKDDITLSKYPFIWGWASWRRVWKEYDVNMKNWPRDKKTIISNVSKRNKTRKYLEKLLDRTYNQEIDTWDYQLYYLMLKKKMFCVVPKNNMITNIGFGINATHTKNKNSEKSLLKKSSMNNNFSFQIDHNTIKKFNELLDHYEYPPHFYKNKINDLIRKTENYFKRFISTYSN